MKQKRKGRRLFVFLCCFLIFISVFWYIQNYTFLVSETTIYTDKVTSTVTIAQLSDLHGATYGENNCNLVSAVKDEQPDLICVTGDMFTNGDTQGFDTACFLLKQLTDIAPVYFVPGEHDNDEVFIREISSYGVKPLLYQKESVTIRENQVTLYGINNVYYTDTFNLFREFDKPSENSFNVLLAHIPNFDAFNWFGPDLSLCGDTHGGVVQIPFIGPLFFEGEWLPELTSESLYITDKGLFDTFTGHVYVSGGLGNYPYPVRCFNRPELSVLKILPKEDVR